MEKKNILFTSCKCEVKSRGHCSSSNEDTIRSFCTITLALHWESTLVGLRLYIPQARQAGQGITILFTMVDVHARPGFSCHTDEYARRFQRQAAVVCLQFSENIAPQNDSVLLIRVQ